MSIPNRNPFKIVLSEEDRTRLENIGIAAIESLPICPPGALVGNLHLIEVAGAINRVDSIREDGDMEVTLPSQSHGAFVFTAVSGLSRNPRAPQDFKDWASGLLPRLRSRLEEDGVSSEFFDGLTEAARKVEVTAPAAVA